MSVEKASVAIYKTLNGRYGDFNGSDADDAADAIAAAGLLPRVVETVEELDALPARAVVRESGGTVWDRASHAYSDDLRWWQPGEEDDYPSSVITLPATVLYQPEVQA